MSKMEELRKKLSSGSQQQQQHQQQQPQQQQTTAVVPTTIGASNTVGGTTSINIFPPSTGVIMVTTSTPPLSSTPATLIDGTQLLTAAATATTSTSTSTINEPTTILTTPLSTSSSTAMLIPMPNAVADPERTYIFPTGINQFGGGGSGVGLIPGSNRIADIMASRGHSRSVSHGGGGSLSSSYSATTGHMAATAANAAAAAAAASSTNTATSSHPIGSFSGVGIIGGNVTRPLKSAMKGHQRAFSQGQITSHSALTAPRSGHTRVGSKTDFILPPGHKESSGSGGGIGINDDDSGGNNIGCNDGTAVTDITSTGGGSGGGSSGGHGGGGGGGSGGDLLSSGSSGGRGHSRQASRSESIYTLRRAEIPPWWQRFIFCRNNKFDDRGYRIVVPNHTVPPKTPKSDHPNGRRMGNKIHTTKYTLLSFLPKNLLEQFHRVANLYFIFIVLLNWFIDAFGKEIAMIPVLFVLGVTAIKDLFEDRRRRASDKRINNSTCRVYNGESERYKKIAWKDVHVGDIVHLSNNETVPADILLLRSSNAEGVCYIDTCDLDGETNLKSREVIRGFGDKQKIFTPSKFTCRVEVDAPSTKIYRFHGAILHASGKRVPISSENLLLRESRLKNTDFAEGIVVYAGHETKAMLNNSGPRYKRSQLEQQMNVDVIWCVIILIILCVIGAVGCKMWLTTFEGLTISFLPFEVNPNAESLWTFWTYVIILQVMIPLSLYVTLELCKILQVYHIHNNIELFDIQTNKRTECRAMNITEELGQVQHIFTDKTGTLTENKMLFRRCTVNGIDYNHPRTALEDEYSSINAPAPPIQVNSKFIEDLSETDGLLRSTPNSQRIQEFFLVLTICNTVVVSATPHHDLMNASGMIESQDERRVKIVKPTEAVNLITIGGGAENSGLGASGGSSGGGGGGASGSNGNIAGSSSSSSTSSTSSSINDRYTRLAESRSITPSPPPSSSSSSIPAVVASSSSAASSSSSSSVLGHQSSNLNHKQQQHIPSLSPINSSAESTPTTKSPQLKHKSLTRNASTSNSMMSPTAKAKTIITSKISTLTSILQNKSNHKKITSKIKRSTPRPDVSGGTATSITPTAGSGLDAAGAAVRPIFEAESPDELALVNAAFSYDYCLINRSPHHIVVSAFDQSLFEYEILKVLPFDSSRKCMSVVVRKVASGITSQEICLYTKGADSAVMSSLAPCNRGTEAERLRDQTQQQLDAYARQGLRVLVMAKRILSPAEFTDWWHKHQEIEMSMENREKRLRDSFSNLEKNLTLLGATGIEDRLQEGVPETIEALRSAGIAIWVLTGDKPETAINVAHSAKVFQPQMELLRLTARSRNAAEASITFYLSEVERQIATHPGKQRALVVDGKTLTFILDLRSNLTKPFLRLTKYCASVLCCRSTPLQKAYLVKIVKEELHLSTLAIGDGANDVSMIQMADVGVGISGQEGMQAVMASDFTLSRFKFLEKLLLNHGFWSYDRLARMILYFFYKNATFVFLIFWYQLYCGFSGAVMIDQIYLMLYNLLFTSLPPLAIGVYDKVVTEDLLFSRPYLYRYGRLGLAYKPHSFWITMLDSLYQSLVIFFIAEAAYWDSTVDMWEFGATITVSCLIAMVLHGAIEIKTWTILHVLSIICSLGAFYLFALIYNSVCVNCFAGVPSQYWVIHTCLSSPIHWQIIIITGVVCVLPRFIFRIMQAMFWPDDTTQAVIEHRQAQRRGEDLLVAWSRSTSASSIYRATDSGTKNKIIATIG